MMALFFLKGLLIGLIFGLPAGAIGALTIQRTIEKGFVTGIITGAGSSVADLIFSCVGIFGISVISDFLTDNQSMIQIIGGILIFFLGISTLRKKEFSYSAKSSKSSPVFCFLSSFAASILNPATILAFMIAFTAFGITGDLTSGQRLSLVIGIVIGTQCWWFTVCGVVSLFRKKLTDRVYKLLNRILGCLMIVFSIAMIVRAVIIM